MDEVFRGDRLWFDVEERYNATNVAVVTERRWLWFDVEERYNATFSSA